MMTSFTSPKLNVGMRGGAHSTFWKFNLHIVYLEDSLKRLDTL